MGKIFNYFEINIYNEVKGYLVVWFLRNIGLN